jgi:hypothetical protein
MEFAKTADPTQELTMLAKFVEQMDVLQYKNY